MQIAAELALTLPAVFAWIAAHAQAFASSAGSSLVTAIWQGAVIVCVLEIAVRLMPRISAAHRFVLWSAGFILSLALPLLSLLNLSGDSAPVLASGFRTTAPSHPLLQLDARWGFAIAGLWLTASLIRAAALAVHSIRLRRLWKAAVPVLSNSALSPALSELRRGRTAVCTTRLLDRPSVIGFLSPRILIPDWLFSRLTPGELDQIVLHEAEHLRRADDWTNLLQKICLVVFPLNPALAWIEHRLCREREMACDEGVVRITNAPKAYAACLASLAERRLERRAEALSLGAWHRRSELVHRVHRILLHQHSMSKTAAGALLAALGSMLLAGSVEMSRLPQLVSFIPEHNAQATAPARQAQLDALLSSETAEAKPVLPASYRAVTAKAVLHDQRSIGFAQARKHAAVKPAPESRPTGTVPPTGAQLIAQSDQLADRVLPSGPQPQQWVVVTEWREFSSANRVPQTISDYAPASVSPESQAKTNDTHSSAASTNLAPQPPNRPNSTTTQQRRYSVTQLILRVVPASPSSGSTQPPTTMVREGWFVIQL